jgi:hypothetical protein
MYCISKEYLENLRSFFVPLRQKDLARYTLDYD